MISFKKKVESGFLKKKSPYVDFSIADYNAKSKKKVITPELLQNMKDKKRLSEIISKNVFMEDQYLDLSFHEAKIVRTVFSFCDLNGCDFSGATLIRCDFSFAKLDNCDFSNSIMIECNFRHAYIKNSNFSGVDDFLCDFNGVII